MQRRPRVPAQDGFLHPGKRYAGVQITEAKSNGVRPLFVDFEGIN